MTSSHAPAAATLCIALLTGAAAAQDHGHGQSGHAPAAQRHMGHAAGEQKEHDHGAQDHSAHAGHAAGAGDEHDHVATDDAAHAGHSAGARKDHDHGSHDHSEHAAPAAKDAQPAADVDLRDRTLVDQHGREHRFVTDVIGDRIVVMDFVFTHCTNVCPILSAVMSQVRHSLGERVGDEVVLVSMTVDPVRDTPARLKAYAAKYGADAGWTWLTGPKGVVDDVLTGLGAYSPSFEDHPAMVLVGDGRTGEWQRFFGFPSADRIMERVDALAAARGQDTAQTN